MQCNGKSFLEFRPCAPLSGMSQNARLVPMSFFNPKPPPPHPMQPQPSKRDRPAKNARVHRHLLRRQLCTLSTVHSCISSTSFFPFTFLKQNRKHHRKHRHQGRIHQLKLWMLSSEGKRRAGCCRHDRCYRCCTYTLLRPQKTRTRT